MIFSSIFIVGLWAMVDATPIQENSLKHVERSYLLGRTNESKMKGQRLFIDTSTCSKLQQEAVNEAWGDAASLAKATAGKSIYDLTSKAQWFGMSFDRRRSTSHGAELSEWEMIEKNIARQLKFYDPNVPHGTLTFLSCPSQHAECTPGVIAASADAQIATEVHHYTLFCPAFFNYNSLTQSLANVSNNQQEQMVMENYWGNQGYSFFHETYHYEATVSIPRLSDPCYGPANCWNLALSENIGSTSHSADTYALEAMARFAQHHFNLTYPPVPRAISDNLLALVLSTPTRATSAAKSPQTQYYKALETVPADLFNTTNAIDAAGADLDPRWKLMVRSGSGSAGTSSVSILTSTESVLVSTSASSGSMTDSSGLTSSAMTVVTIPGGPSETDSSSVLPRSTISGVSATGVSSSATDSSSVVTSSTISGVISSVVASSSISDSSSVLTLSTISITTSPGTSSIETDSLSVLTLSTFSTLTSPGTSSSTMTAVTSPGTSSVETDSSSVLTSSTISTLTSPGTSSIEKDSSSPLPSSTISTSTLRGPSSSQTYSSSQLPSSTLSATTSTSPFTTTSISTQPSPTSIFSTYFGTLPITFFSNTNTNAAPILTSSPTSPSSSPTPTPTPPINTSSPTYKTCITNLGASTCKANDGTCLTNQCLGDKDCKEAGVACAEVGVGNVL